MNNMITQKAYLAGGCFWGLEELLRTQKGVLDTTVGYTGGRNDNPTYEFHPGHAETVEVVFDSHQTTYEEILKYFFRVHNPTTLNQQGNDIGSSYRSAIFYVNVEQKEIAQQVIMMVNVTGKWDKPVVTEVISLQTFWKAEEYHQDYLQKNPGGYTCHMEYFDSY